MLVGRSPDLLLDVTWKELRSWDVAHKKPLWPVVASENFHWGPKGG